MSARRVAVALALLAGTAAAEAPPLRFSGDLGGGYDSNVANAQDDAEVRDDSFVTASLGADVQRELTPYSTLQLRGSVLGERYSEFDGLSNAKGALLARGMLRPSGGFYAPLLAAWASAARWEFDSDIRDSTEYRAGAFAVEQLTTQVSARLGAAYTKRLAAGEAFDLSGYSGSLNLDWMVAPRVTVYGGYQHYVGDVVSTGRASYGVVRWADRIEPDDAFGDFATGQFAYRLDGTAQIGTAGLNVALSRRFSIDVQGQYIATAGDGGNDYERWITTAGLFARF